MEERYPDLEDRLVSAVELGSGENPRISPVILEKLLEDTRFHIETLNLPKTVRTKGAVLWGSFALVTCGFLGSIMLSHLDFFVSQSNRIFTPWKITPKISRPKLTVIPGDARVPKGSTQEIRAELTGFETEEVTLYFTTNDTTWDKTDMDRTEQKGIYVYNFFDIQDKTRYYVKADEKLSKIYTFSVYDAPQIKRVDLTYIYPSYTGLKPKKEVDTGDIWAPEGTVVKIKAVSDKKLRKGQIILGHGNRLKTGISSDTLLTASFTITQDTYYKIRITDNDGLSNDPPPEYYVYAIPDQPPILSLEKPGHDKKATMVEEVPIKVRVQDDFGLSSLKLFYTINGGDEKEINLLAKISQIGQQKHALNELKEFTAEHLFYLEDLGLQPGDFLTYYMQAHDNRTSETVKIVSSDIYFIEIRPFEREFFRPISQGKMGGGSEFGGQLSGTQKEIIVATWKLQKRKENLSSIELTENVEVIIESQKNLKEITQTALYQMEQRSLFSNESGGEIAQYFSKAVQAMERAVDELKARRIEEALMPEREAYQNLLRAEAQIKEVQMQMAQAQGLGGGATLDELAQLFEDEMDKFKNKYETLRQNQQRRVDEELNEALQKVKDLARRQQLFNQQVRDLARKEISPREKKRRIEELRRQQEKLKRETQELNRQIQNLRKQGSDIPKDIQSKLRQASSEMNNASSDFRKENLDMAAAKGRRALNSLKRLENKLRRNLNESLRRQFESLEQEFQRLAEAQKELTKDVEKLAQEKVSHEEKLQEAQEDQAQIKEDLTELQQDLLNLSRKAQEAKKDVSRNLKKIWREMAGDRIEEKMESAQRLLGENRLNSALQGVRDIQKMLKHLSEKLTRIRGEFAETDEEKLDLALQQTQKLREDLESLQRQTHALNRPGDKHKKEGERADNLQAGPGETGTPPPKLDSQQLERWNEKLALALKDLGAIGESVRVDTSLVKELDKIGNNMLGIVRNFGGGDPNKIRLIEDKILEPLKNFEAELAQKLEILKNKEKLFLAPEEKIPPEYEELVEKYYEALSKTK